MWFCSAAAAAEQDLGSFDFERRCPLHLVGPQTVHLVVAEAVSVPSQMHFLRPATEQPVEHGELQYFRARPRRELCHAARVPSGRHVARIALISVWKRKAATT